MASWAEAKRAAVMARQAKTTADYARLMAVSQAADKAFVSYIQLLRNRHQPAVRTLQVSGAATVAVQINENGPPADPGRAKPAERCRTEPACGAPSTSFRQDVGERAS